MDWFEQIKKWYDQGLWKDSWVIAAVGKGKITQDQADAIFSQSTSANAL